MRIHSDTARRHASGISDNTLIRIRASSPRLVSCVAVVSISLRPSLETPEVGLVELRRRDPQPPGIPADFVG